MKRKMTTSNRSVAGLGSLMFKIRFIRTMLPSMSVKDLGIFYAACLRILLGEVTTEDIEEIGKLYNRFSDEDK